MATKKFSTVPAAGANANSNTRILGYDNTGPTVKTWTPAQAHNLQIINVADYLSVSQQADVTAWTGLVDVTSAVTAAIAAVPSTGGVLYFPPGRYVTTGGFTIANPTRIIGAGQRSIVSGNGIAQIECNSNTAVLFTVTALEAKFENISLECTGGAPTAGSGVFVNGSDAEQVVDFSYVQVRSFYDCIDHAVGEGWRIDHCRIMNFARYGVRVRNVVNGDAGDWSITESFIAANSNVGNRIPIRLESSGGGFISGNKILSGLHGISADYTGVSTIILQIVDNNIENFHGEAIYIAAGIPLTSIQDNYISNLPAASGTATLQLYTCDDLIVSGNTLVSPGTANAIEVYNSTRVTIGPQRVRPDTTLPLWLNGGCVDVQSYEKSPITVSNLPVATQMKPGSVGFVTDANASTFGTVVAGGGANLVPVWCDGTNWRIG